MGRVSFRRGRGKCNASVSRGGPGSFPLVLPPPTIRTHRVDRAGVLPRGASSGNGMKGGVMPTGRRTEVTGGGGLGLPGCLGRVLAPFSPVLD